MPQTYEITAPNGKTLSVTGDHIPTETELHQMFAAAGVETGTAPAPSGDALIANVKNLAAGAGTLAPTIGGMIGGAVGGVPGAALGGAAGQGYQELASHAAELPGAVADVAKNLVDQPKATLQGFAEGSGLGAAKAALEGGAQAAGQYVGNKLADVAASTGKFLMGQALSPTQTLARQFPDLSQTAIAHALTVSKGGLQDAYGALKAAKATANAALDTAAKNGATVPLTAATDALAKTFDQVAVNGSAPDQALSALARIERQIGSGRSGTLTMREADALKTSLQTEVSALYKQVAAGMGTKGKSIEMIAKADMAAALNDAIEQAATKAGAPGYKAANSVAQDLIGATRAISRRLFQAEEPIGQVAADLATPAVMGSVLRGGSGAIAAAGGTMAAKVAALPSNLSRMALTASHPATQAFVRQLPKPVLQAIADYLWPTSGTSTEAGR